MNRTFCLHRMLLNYKLESEREKKVFFDLNYISNIVTTVVLLSKFT